MVLVLMAFFGLKNGGESANAVRPGDKMRESIVFFRVIMVWLILLAKCICSCLALYSVVCQSLQIGLVLQYDTSLC